MNRSIFARAVLFLCVIVLFCFSCGCASRFAGKEILRVAVVDGSGKFNLSSSSPVMIRETRHHKRIFRGQISTPVPISADPRGIRFGNKLHKIQSFTIIPRKDGSINIDGTKYRGSFKVLRKDQLLWAVNYVHVEDYLRGVVPSEMPPGWDIDALKSQAIVSRSYAMFHAIKNNKNDYDLTGTSQMYKGVGAEHERTDNAVKSTRNMVIYYKNKLLSAYCCSSCGGHTELPSFIWETNYSYPRPVPCPYCKQSKNFRWNERISSDFLGRKLRPLGIDRVLAIRPSKKSPYSGRITELKVYHRGGNKSVRLNKFRALLGYNLIRSGNFTIKKDGNHILFEGRGWGHGAGLCQQGTNQMAKLGKSYKKIIRFYFPATRIGRFK